MKKKDILYTTSPNFIIKAETAEASALSKSLIERGVYADDGADLQLYKYTVKGTRKRSKPPRECDSSAEP